MHPLIKALILISMGLFLYTRFFNGILLYYINERFVWLTLAASLLFIVVGFSYRYQMTDEGRNLIDHDKDNAHGKLSWLGLSLVLAPIILGVFVPPRPLGASAMSNRDVSVESLTSVETGQREVLSKPKAERNVLDWLIDILSANDPKLFDGEEANVVGFVYRDERFVDGAFMVSRFTVSCCAADAIPMGLVVEGDGLNRFELDQWVRVTGNFKAGVFDGKEMPILHVTNIELTDIPSQPYLYPY